MRTAIAAAVLLLGLTGPAAANEQVMTFFTPDAVAAALRAAGATGVTVAQGGERPSITASDGAGRALYVSLHVCAAEAPAQCRGLSMSYSWDPQGRIVDLRSVNAFNAFSFAKANVQPDGTLVLHRYLIADEGVTPGNLRENLAIFMRMPDQMIPVIKFLDAPPVRDGRPSA